MLGELNNEEIDQVLANNVTGRIGCTEDGKVYIVPISYAFNNTYIIAHSREGMKIDMMRKHPLVCFQVDEMTDLSNWRSVVLWGNYEEITDPKERYYAMKFLVSRLAQLPVSETAGVAQMHQELQAEESTAHIIRPVVYRIRIKEKTGRFEKG
ncbi:pyridoxamine 5'-phosphate oxidase family protein [Chitinophaga eiseniae]|uniref:Pyridoxamine 5'-phosphate oxidase family protein n=1 Tax=Chitinophaga eiseniae TaxID=634771 RepID=A0A847S841_9BACT|nr:pyridoxamine 5'-phosphate oxidase family protein [Chitinophaga eiseniae]NLR77961.1 pyridoxamine 5'-phosphate oxidase family protein [Chitinophaga eiseniae]